MPRRRRRRQTRLDGMAIGILALGGLLFLYATRDLLGELLPFLVVAIGLCGVGYLGWKIWSGVRLTKDIQHDFTRYTYLEQIMQMDPWKFEALVAWAFDCRGYDVEVTPRSGDHGLDVILKKNGRTSVAQVKRYAKGHNVPEKELRDLYGSFVDMKGVRGYFITTSDFTPPARAWAEERNITLMNGTAFLEFIRATNPKEWSLLLFRQLFPHPDGWDKTPSGKS